MGGLPKRGAWTVCRFKGGLARKRGVVFLRGVDTPMNTMRQYVGIVSKRRRHQNEAFACSTKYFIEARADFILVDQYTHQKNVPKKTKS